MDFATETFIARPTRQATRVLGEQGNQVWRACKTDDAGSVRGQRHSRCFTAFGSQPRKSLRSRHHPLTLQAPPLIEATCLQVNHEGHYTGITQADFARRIAEIVVSTGFDGELIFWWDHLGANL